MKPLAREAWAVVLAFACATALCRWRYQPVSARGADAAPTVFSAVRARAHLVALVGDGAPHPIGGAADARVRDEVVRRFTALGYAPSVQQGFACAVHDRCARYGNVVARLAGRVPDGTTVLLAAHLDSVPAAPGASDDGAAVASVLEIARALRAAPPRHDVVFLIEDGEEFAGLGARHFVAEHPWARTTRAVVNLDAHGTCGPTVLYQTSRDTRAIVPYVASAPRPMTSSALVLMSRLVGADSDFTVLAAGPRMLGFNLASSGCRENYHTRRDDLAHVPLDSLQHRGETMLVLARRLADADLAHAPRGECVWTDVAAFTVLCWPRAATPWIALVPALILAVDSWRRRRAITLPRVGLGVLVWLATIALPVLLGALHAELVMRVTTRAPAVLAAAWLGWLASALCPAGVALGLVPLVARRLDPLALRAGAAMGWCLATLLIAIAVPDASPLVLPTAFALALDANLGRRDVGTALVVFVTAVVWLPPLALFRDNLGLYAIGVHTAMVALACSVVWPRVIPCPRWIPLMALVAVGVMTALLGWLPPFSARVPGPDNLAWVQFASEPRARLVTDGDPVSPFVSPHDPLPIDGSPARWLPWLIDAARTESWPGGDVPAPEVTVMDSRPEGDARVVRVRIRSMRGAERTALVLPPEARLRRFVLDGAVVTQPFLFPDPALPLLLEDESTQPDGAVFELTLGASQPVHALAFDRTHGVPPSVQPRVRARPDHAVETYEGDRTLAARPFDL